MKVHKESLWSGLWGGLRRGLWVGLYNGLRENLWDGLYNGLWVGLYSKTNKPLRIFKERHGLPLPKTH